MFLFSLDSGNGIHGRIYMSYICFGYLWIMTIVYILGYMFLFSLDSDYKIHVRVYVSFIYISVLSG